MSCTFKEYLSKKYKLTKVKDLKSLKTKPSVHGIDHSDSTTGIGVSEDVIIEKHHKKKYHKRNKQTNRYGSGYHGIDLGLYGYGGYDRVDNDGDSDGGGDGVGESFKLIKLQNIHSTESQHKEGEKTFNRSLQNKNFYKGNQFSAPYHTGATEWDNDADVTEDEEEPVDSDKDSKYNNSSTHKKDSDEHKKYDSDKDDENKDPDKQGLIRKIDGAHLVYKRINEDGTYDELWMYNISRGNKNEYTIRSEILANTDIEQKSGVSASGTQKYILWTNNNVQMMQVTGLPN